MLHAKSPQSCPAFCDPMDCSLPGSPAHGILQARILEWVAMPSSREDLSNPGIKGRLLCLLLWQAGASLPVPPGIPMYYDIMYNMEKKDFCNLMGCSLPGSSVHGTSQAGILEWVPLPSPGIFPTQGLNPRLLHWQADSLPLSHLGSPLYIKHERKTGKNERSIHLKKLEKE